MLSMLALVLGLSASGTMAVPPDGEVDVELVLAVDTSRSMDFEEARIQREGYVEAIKHKEFLAAVKGGLTGRIAISYFEWAGDVVQGSLIDWQVIEDEEDAVAFADKLAARPVEMQRRTSISAAIKQAAVMLTSNSYKGIRQVIDISGDGANNTGVPVQPARDSAIKAGIVINGLAIMLRPSGTPGGLDRYYADCVVGGPGSFVLPVHKIEDFGIAVRRKLVMEVSGLQPPPQLHRIAAKASSTDCLIGEKLWQDMFDR